MSYTTADEIVVEPYEEVVHVGNPHYNTSSIRSSSPVAEEDWSMAETFKGPTVNSSRGVDITAQILRLHRGPLWEPDDCKSPAPKRRQTSRQQHPISYRFEVLAHCCLNLDTGVSGLVNVYYLS